MALQEDPSKYFGSVDYFRNKDEQRRTVNDMRREERNKRIMQQGLTRNIKKAIREGKDPRGFIGAARDLGLSAAGGGGIGQEASQRDAELRARAASLFEGVQAQKSKAEGTIGGVPTPSGGMVSPTPAINQPATQKPQGTATTSEGKTIPAIPFVGPPAPNTQQSQAVAPTKPSWADEVKNDRTFKNVDLTNPRFAGKTREEARQMVMSQKAQNAMRGFNQAGKQSITDQRQAKLDAQNSAIVDFINKDSEAQQKVNFDERVRFMLSPEELAYQERQKQKTQESNLFLSDLEKKLPALNEVVNKSSKIKESSNERFNDFVSTSEKNKTENLVNELYNSDSQLLNARQQSFENRQKEAEQLASMNLDNERQLQEETFKRLMQDDARQTGARRLFDITTEGIIYNSLDNAVQTVANGIKKTLNPYL